MTKYKYNIDTSSVFAEKTLQKVPMISPENSALALFNAFYKLSFGSND